MQQILLPFIVLAIILYIRYLFYLRTQRIAEEILEEFKGQCIDLRDIFIKFNGKYSGIQILESIRYLHKKGKFGYKKE